VTMLENHRQRPGGPNLGGPTDDLLRSSDLPGIRNYAAEVASRSGLDDTDVDDFVLAVSEAATNVIRHAGGRGRVLVWSDGTQLIAEITDDGPGLDSHPETGRPEPGAAGGRGFWLMHRCVDSLEVLTRAVGTRIRLIKVLVQLALIAPAAITA